MGKSFVFYTKVYVEGDLVNCIYFINGKCWAQPFAARSKLSQSAAAEQVEFYKPTEEEQKKYCMNIGEFRACPRFQAYQDDLKARGLEK